MYFFKYIFSDVFNSFHALHIVFITTVSVFFKEFVYFLYEYFEDLKLKNINSSTSEGERGIKTDLPSISTKDTETSGSKDTSILDDPRNYGYDSDTELKKAIEESKKLAHQAESSKTGGESSKTGGESSKTEAESSKTGAQSLRESSPVRGEYIPALTKDETVFKKDMENNVNIPEIEATKFQLYELKDTYANSGLPPYIIEKNTSSIVEKIRSCENRLSELRNENVENEGKGKGKGKGS